MKGVGRWFEESETGRSEEGAQGERDCGILTEIPPGAIDFW